MGYLYKGFCYSDISKLKDAIFSYEQIVFNDSTTNLISNLYVTDPTKIKLWSESEYSASIMVNFFRVTIDPTQLTTVTGAPGIINVPKTISASNFDFGLTIKKCSNSGSPIESMNITLQNPPDNFNPSNLNPSDVFNSIGSGFLLVAVPLAVVWAGRHFLRPLFSK